jgi:hypothetical protein
MATTNRLARNLANAHPLAEPRARGARGALPLALAALGVLSSGACGPSSKSHPLGVSRTSAALDQTVLGSAQSFVVLGGSTVTNIGTTTVDGNLGVDPGLAVTGFPPGLVTGGSIHAGDAIALQAQNDTTTAYNTLAGQAPTVDLTGQDLGGMTLVAGVYHFSSSAQLTGALTLDAKGDPSAVFVFQVGSTLTTASNSSVLVLGGAQDCNIFWQVGSSATIGTTTAFKGNILALTSITLTTGATVRGRALARNAAVTMDTNDVSDQTCAASADAGVDAGTGSDSDASASGGGLDGGSDGDFDSSSSSTSDSNSGGGSIDSSTGGSDGSASGSSSGSGSGGEAGIDGSVADASEAGNNLCCGGVLCGTSCIDLSADTRNCGSCGHVCASDQICTGGSCAPCSPVCGGVCATLDSDHANCGACGHGCLASERCTSGACVTCSATCGGACADLAWDRPNCGSCGHVCPASAVCFNGVCQTCSTLCGGACADLANDRQNCGSCGNLCAPGDSCNSGACVCQ